MNARERNSGRGEHHSRPYTSHPDSLDRMRSDRKHNHRSFVIHIQLYSSRCLCLRSQDTGCRGGADYDPGRDHDPGVDLDRGHDLDHGHDRDHGCDAHWDLNQGFESR